MLEAISGNKSGVDADAIAKAMGKEMTGITETMGAIQKKLDGDEKSETKKLMEDFIKRVSPGEGDPKEPDDPFKQFDKAQEFVNKTKGLLEKAGFSINTDTITRDQLPDVMKDMDADDLSKLLESKGYKISGRPVPFTEYEKKINEAKESGRVEGTEDKSAELAAQVIENITTKFFETVLGPMVQKDWNAPMSEEEYKEPTVEKEHPESSETKSPKE